MNTLIARLIVFSLPLLMQGCGGILTSDQPARQVYLLTPLEAPVASAVAAASAGLTLEFTAIPGLDTDRVLALGADPRLQQYGNARWPDHLPEVLASVLQRSLESAGGFDTVRLADAAVDGDWMLRLEVREFYGLLDQAGDTTTVRVGLAGRIVCADQNHALRLEDSGPVAGQRLASVVAGHQAGLDAVTLELIEGIRRTCGAGGAE